MTIKYSNVGRSKASGTVKVKELHEIIPIVSQFLMSSQVDVAETKTERVYDVIVGGWRPVGKIEIVKL